MKPRVYRKKELVSKPGRPGMLPISDATLWRWCREGRFPQPFKLGPQTTVWCAGEVDQFIAKMKAESGVAV